MDVCFGVCVCVINQSIFLTFISGFYIFFKTIGHKISPIQGHYKSMINRDRKPVKLETLVV
jgi:hypothetical protein